MSDNKFEDFNEGDHIEVVNYTAGDVERLNIMGMRGTVIPGTFGSTFLSGTIGTLWMEKRIDRFLDQRTTQNTLKRALDVENFAAGLKVKVIKLPPEEPTDTFLNATGTVAEPDSGSMLIGCVKVDLDAPQGEVLWLLCYPDELEVIGGDS